MKSPNPCPDNNYVEKTLYQLIKKQVSDDNIEAFRGSNILPYAGRRALAKLVCHYEPFKSVMHLPGHIVELGVFKGESLLRFAQFSEIFLV